MSCKEIILIHFIQNCLCILVILILLYNPYKDVKLWELYLINAYNYLYEFNYLNFYEFRI